MSNEGYNPKPKASTRCVICGGYFTFDTPFIAAKPRRGATIFAHTECLEQEQRDILLNKSLAAHEVFEQRGGGEA